MSLDAARRAWLDLQNAVASAERAVVAAAPDEETAQEGLAYVGRCLASALDGALSPERHLKGGLYYAEHLEGGANPDYRMGQAVIMPGARYRIGGSLNGAIRFGVGLYSPKPGFGLTLQAYSSVDGRNSDANGRFSLTIGPDADSSLLSSANSRVLITRELTLRRGDAPAAISLERLDAAPVEPGPDLAARLMPAQAQMGPIFEEFLRWSELLATAPNCIIPLPDTLNDKVQGDPDTRYFSGYFNLQPGEALRVDVAIPPCTYWMIQTLTHWLEIIPGANYNGATALLSGDGATFWISASDPGHPNWLDTRGRARGAIFFRTLGATATIRPTAQVVMLDRAA